MGGNPPPPFAENSTKIINLIFEPFPKVVIKFVLEDQDIPMVSIPQDCWQKVEEFTAIYPEAVLLGNSDC